MGMTKQSENIEAPFGNFLNKVSILRIIFLEKKRIHFTATTDAEFFIKHKPRQNLLCGSAKKK